MFYFYNLTGKEERRQVHDALHIYFVIYETDQPFTTETRSLRILRVSHVPVFFREYFSGLVYGVNLIESVIHMPFCPSLEQSVIVARSLCPLGS